MKPKLEYSEFYITNVCNLNCDECNRFNNYHFTGHQLWNEYKDIYREWGKHIDLVYISILGGEPLLNPSISDWIYGIRDIWSKPTIEVTTNGSRLTNVKKLYRTAIDNNVLFHVSLHNQANRCDIEKKIRKFLRGTIIETIIVPDDLDLIWQQHYNRIKQVGWAECKTYLHFEKLPNYQQTLCISNGLNPRDFLNFNSHTEFVDENGLKVVMYVEDVFYHSALQLNNNTFTLHNSNPTTAHSHCFGKNNYHFIKGKLYKCGVSGILPEFINQFPVSISTADKELINSYIPLSIENIHDITNFIDNLPNEIPQCKFCSEGRGESFKLNATIGNKIKVTWDKL